MTDDEGSMHPEEGTIHAWLDGALEPAATAWLEAHVAECASCAARVAEARGLIAGASRVVGQLDDAPAPLIRPAPIPRDGGSMWRILRVTPARSAIAAVLLVAVGITLTRQRGAVESSRLPADRAVAESVQLATGADAQTDAPSAPARDSVLGSAIARRLADEQPPRTFEATPGIAIPTAPPPPGGNAAAAQVESRDAIRVATARASLRAQRESASAASDRTRAGVANAAPGFNVPTERAIEAAKAADRVAGTRPALDARAPGVPGGAITAGECYRVDGASGAMWGPVSLPLIVAVDSSGLGARILRADGAETNARAALSYADGDSIVLRLRRIGYDGTMTLGGIGTSRTGTMRSNTLSAKLSQTVVTAAGARADEQSRGGKAVAPQQRPTAGAPAPGPAAPVAAARSEIESRGTLTPVTARRVSCPSR